MQLGRVGSPLPNCCQPRNENVWKEIFVAIKLFWLECGVFPIARADDTPSFGSVFQKYTMWRENKGLAQTLSRAFLLPHLFELLPTATFRSLIAANRGWKVRKNRGKPGSPISSQRSCRRALRHARQSTVVRVSSVTEKVGPVDPFYVLVGFLSILNSVCCLDEIWLCRAFG